MAGALLPHRLPRSAASAINSSIRLPSSASHRTTTAAATLSGSDSSSPRSTTPAHAGLPAIVCPISRAPPHPPSGHRWTTGQCSSPLLPITVDAHSAFTIFSVPYDSVHPAHTTHHLPAGNHSTGVTQNARHPITAAVRPMVLAGHPSASLHQPTPTATATPVEASRAPAPPPSS